MHVLYYDEKYNYIGEDDISTDIIPPNSTLKTPDPSIISPRFDIKLDEWVESATEEYKESIKPEPPEPSDIDILGQSLSTFRISLLQINKTTATILKDIAELKGGTSQ